MTNLFDPTDVPSVREPVKFDDLVGEGKKFRDPDALANGKQEADIFIERLKEELADTRRQLQSQERLDEIKELLLRSNAPSRTDNQTDPNPGVHEPNAAPFKPEDLKQLLEQTLSEREVKARQEANLETARKALVDAFGNGYVETLKIKAQELGMSQDKLHSLAAESPAALLRLVGVEPNKPAPNNLFTPPSSQVRSSTSNPMDQDRTQKYYKELKARDPKEYWRAETQIKMEKDAQRLGPAFFNA